MFRNKSWATYAALFLPLAAALPAHAQQADSAAGTQVFTDVPDGFSAASASDAALAAYGFPPRPDRIRQPDAYAQWLRATSPAVKRIVPQLRLTNIHHNLRRASAVNADQSSNWSGFVDYWGGTTFNTKSINNISGYWVVPSAAVAFGSCTGTTTRTPVYSSTWVGIDGAGNGLNSTDLLQAGTESDAQCKAGKLLTHYDTWFEWVPNAETVITNFVIGPGDDMYVNVSASSATQGLAYVVDYHTNRAASIKFTAPAGTTLIGDSAEWIVERPTINGTLATLTNYGMDYMAGAEATNAVHAIFQPGTSYTPGTYSGTPTDMTDNNGNVISTPGLIGPSAIIWQVSGSAQ